MNDCLPVFVPDPGPETPALVVELAPRISGGVVQLNGGAYRVTSPGLKDWADGMRIIQMGTSYRAGIAHLIPEE